jgi:imidazolonepropionase-like amidohydrolase
MKSKGIYMVPTDPSISVYLKAYELQNIKNKSVDDIKKELEPLHSRVMRAFNKGVMIVAGSDAYVDFKMPQGEVAKEFISSYFDAGLKPNDVLRTATYNASIALGKKGQIGVLKEKANADIAIFNGDIEKDFRKSLFDVKMVIKDGKVVYSK